MKYHFKRGFFDWVRKFISGPFVLVVLVPIVILDAFVELHHQVGFRLLGIKRVKRSDYVRIDRHRLSYLTPAQKVFCMYCGYANGLLHYASHIAAETEAYWCGVMHEQKPQESFNHPSHHKYFIAYGDKEAYQREIERAKSEH